MRQRLMHHGEVEPASGFNDACLAPTVVQGSEGNVRPQMLGSGENYGTLWCPGSDRA